MRTIVYIVNFFSMFRKQLLNVIVHFEKIFDRKFAAGDPRLIGGDSDTMGAITGGIAEAYYGGVPENIKIEVLKRLPNEFIEVMQKFYQKFVDK